MEKYIGTKVVLAKPMNRKEYNDFRGWQVPENENPNDEGYLVEYTDSNVQPELEGKANGYVSWSPKDVFERSYTIIGNDNLTIKVTKEHLESIIVDKKFHRLTETLTVCALTLRNGFTVIGESACVSPANYNQEIGERVAYENAFDKLWQLEGYVLKNKLAGF